MSESICFSHKTSAFVAVADVPVPGRSQIQMFADALGLRKSQIQMRADICGWRILTAISPKHIHSVVNSNEIIQI